MSDVAIHRATMQRLCATTDAIGARVPDGSVFIDEPVYLNIGDLLIHRGTLAALDRAGVTLRASLPYQDLGRVEGDAFRLGRRYGALAGAMRDAPMLVFQGGGNLGDLWLNHQLLREALIGRHHHVPCVILPQSAHYRDPATAERTKRVFGAHQNLMLYCRDQETFDLFESVTHCERAPDMAHSLWRTLPLVPQDRRGDPLVQTRRDSERGGNGPSGGFDWDECEPRAEVLMWRGLVTLRRASAVAPVRAAGDAVWRRLSDAWISRAIARLGDASQLTTDRLHGMLLGALLETPVRFSDNSYGKLSRYAARWFDGDPLVTPVGNG
jgi:pyruvyl transferase EpsO